MASEPPHSGPFSREQADKLLQHAKRNREAALHDYSTLARGACGLPIPPDVIDEWKGALPWLFAKRPNEEAP